MSMSLLPELSMTHCCAELHLPIAGATARQLSRPHAHGDALHAISQCLAAEGERLIPAISMWAGVAPGCLHHQAGNAADAIAVPIWLPCMQLCAMGMSYVAGALDVWPDLRLAQGPCWSWRTASCGDRRTNWCQEATDALQEVQRAVQAGWVGRGDRRLSVEGVSQIGPLGMSWECHVMLQALAPVAALSFQCVVQQSGATQMLHNLMGCRCCCGSTSNMDATGPGDIPGMLTRLARGLLCE